MQFNKYSFCYTNPKMINSTENRNEDILKEKGIEVKQDIKININDNNNYIPNVLNDKENNNTNNQNTLNINNNNTNLGIDFQKYNFSCFNMITNKTCSHENEEMANFDNNCNSENVLDFNLMKNIKNNISSKQKMENENIDNSSYLNYNNNYQQNYQNYMNNNRNINIKKKMDKNYALRNDIAKYFDKLTDNNIVELLVYIENIRPQSIRELPNDTIYINMELFNDDTFGKVLDFIKKY